MRFLIDTNVLSEIRKGVRRGNAGVISWAASHSQADFALSVVTIKEIEAGILSRAVRDPGQSMVYRLWLDHHVLPDYSDRILPIDIAVARKAAALDVPDRRPVQDGLIAATALVHGLTVVTRNIADFRPMGVPVLNPFTA